MKRNAIDTLLTTMLLAIQTFSSGGSIDSPALDCKDADELLLLLFAGTFTGTSVVTWTAEESDDGSTGWSAIPGATEVITEASGEDENIHLGEIDLRLRKRFIRVNVATATADSLLGVLAEFVTIRERPVVQPANTVSAFQIRNDS